jgi:quinol-cytochrome oxidoreductase complex cytochrome b subunit
MASTLPPVRPAAPLASPTIIQPAVSRAGIGPGTSRPGFMQRSLLDYEVPRNLNTLWSFGVMTGFSLMVLAISGIWLAFYYVPTPGEAFNSIQYIERNVHYGWLIRDLHLVGTTMLFGAVYVELFRGIYYGTYRHGRSGVWGIEVARFFLLLCAGFLGYVMIFGPASMASLTIMASCLGKLGHFLIAGFGINAATLPRIETLHTTFGLLAIGAALLGFAASRAAGPANPDGLAVIAPVDMRRLHPYFTLRGAFALIIFLLIFAVIFTFAPHFFSPPGNFAADSLTAAGLAMPINPIPPWYMLGFHGIARAAGPLWFGTALTILAFLLLAALPWLDRGSVASCRYRPRYRGFVFVLAFDWIVLSVLASLPSNPVISIFLEATTIYLFLHFLIITPLITSFEQPRPLPTRPRGALRYATYQQSPDAQQPTAGHI